MLMSVLIICEEATAVAKKKRDPNNININILIINSSHSVRKIKSFLNNTSHGR